MIPGLREATLGLNSENVKIFCINGVIVEMSRETAVTRMPFDIMEIADHPMMKSVIEAQGRFVNYLSPMTSDMLIAEVGGMEVENINKTTANMISTVLRGKEIYGPDSDGVLR